MFCSLLFLFLWVGEEKEITKSRDKESLPKQYDLICSLASCILTLCYTKTSDFGQRCITRHQFPLFMSQQCVHLKKLFQVLWYSEIIAQLFSAGCSLALGQAPAAGHCQSSALFWLQHTGNSVSSGAGSPCFPGIGVWSDRAPSRLQVGVSMFQCGSVSGATAERTWL